ncbi:MAG: M48 family metallopeptidase [Chlamydiales bacterium]
MNFWEAQRRARIRTGFYITIFILFALLIAFLIEVALRYLAKTGETPPLPYMGVLFFVMTVLIAFFYYLTFKTRGGKYVAQSLGAKPVSRTTGQYEEQQFLNIVEEMAVASSQPMPDVFVLESKEINAFAAGIHADNAAITVTRGALRLLNREELQGVIAHEFGHIYNADMKINMRLAAMVMGFMFILFLGIRILEGTILFGGRSGRRNPVALVALVFLAAGAITWLVGAILRSMVSRQREYLADASAVQFTRNPRGIANALRKIGGMKQVHDMPKSGMAYSHLYFENHSFWASLFATHPSLEKRIAAIEGNKTP